MAQMNVTRSSFKLVLSEAIGSVVLFIGLAIFARQLGPEQMGSFFLFKLLVEIFGFISDFGIRGALEKRLSEGEDMEEFLTTAVLLKIAMLLPILGLIVLLRDPINSYLGAELTYFLVTAITLREAGWVFIHLLRGELHAEQTAVIEAIRFVIWMVIGALLVFNGFDVTGVVYGFLAGFFVLALLGSIRSSTRFGRPSMTHAHSLFNYSRYDFINTGGNYIYNWLDVAVIGFFLTQTDVGIYEYAWQITIPVLIVANAVSKSIFPQMSRWNSSAAYDQIEALLPNVFVAGLLISIPSLFGAAVLAEPILYIIYGPEFTAATTILILLMAEKSFRSIHSILSHSIMAMNRPDISARITLIAAVVNLILNLLLVPRVGLIGAAVATVTSSILNTLLLIFAVSEYITFQIPFQTIIWCTFASLCMGGSVLAFRILIPIDTLLILFISVILGVMIYSLLLVANPNFRKQTIAPGINALFK